MLCGAMKLIGVEGDPIVLHDFGQPAEITIARFSRISDRIDPTKHAAWTKNPKTISHDRCLLIALKMMKRNYSPDTKLALSLGTPVQIRLDFRE